MWVFIYSRQNHVCGIVISYFYYTLIIAIKSRKYKKFIVLGTLKKQIDNYMKDFEYFEDESTYGYKKGDLFIQSYEVANEGLYRKIYITY